MQRRLIRGDFLQSRHDEMQTWNVLVEELLALQKAKAQPEGHAFRLLGASFLLNFHSFASMANNDCGWRDKETRNGESGHRLWPIRILHRLQYSERLLS